MIVIFSCKKYFQAIIWFIDIISQQNEKDLTFIIMSKSMDTRYYIISAELNHLKIINYNQFIQRFIFYSTHKSSILRIIVSNLLNTEFEEDKETIMKLLILQ